MEQSVSGIYEPGGKSGGFLRSPEANYRVRGTDPVVTPDLCRANNLRGGESIVAQLGSDRSRSKSRQRVIVDVESVNGLSPDDYCEVKPFEDLTVIDPTKMLPFETPDGPTSMRVVDLLTPIGLGQRGMIVAPPRTGKTVILQQLAAGLSANHPDVHMMVLLIDERPEEVTEMRRTVHGEVIASSNDNDTASHVRIARLMTLIVKRMVEVGRDVFVLLDSLTRLGRAFNAAMRGGRRTMSGGLDITALNEPKSIFGAARNIENGGSLTIIASALIDTGSRMDEVIFNEFKGTGNMEIMLSREMADRRVWPAIDLAGSGTRKEERLLSSDALATSHQLRRSLSNAGPEPAMMQILDLLNRFPTNERLIADHATATRGRIG